MKSHKLIFSLWFEQQDLVVNYLDVGARGDVSEPWSLFEPGTIKVIGFEPDPDECERLSKSYPERKYYPNALWGEKTTQPFYLCEWASTSSMYPPAELSNQQYYPKHWSGRIPSKTLMVECVPLDSIISSEDTPDFIKIDTQGAELEILRGAEQLLRKGAPLVLTETWCTEVYEGSPLTHDVMSYMDELGYQVFDINVAAAWQHQTNALTDSHCKAKTIGFDLLFVKKLEYYKPESVNQLLKFSALCELFGFRDYAVAMLEQSEFKTSMVDIAIKEMVKNERWERSLARKVLKILNKISLQDSRLWPKLH